jgi:hypothetical protein
LEAKKEKEELIGWVSSPLMIKGLLAGYQLIATNKRIIGRSIKGTVAFGMMENIRFPFGAKTYSSVDFYIHSPFAGEDVKAAEEVVGALDELVRNHSLDFEVKKSEISEIEVKPTKWLKGYMLIKPKFGKPIKIRAVLKEGDPVLDLIRRFSPELLKFV